MLMLAWTVRVVALGLMAINYCHASNPINVVLFGLSFLLFVFSVCTLWKHEPAEIAKLRRQFKQIDTDFPFLWKGESIDEVNVRWLNDSGVMRMTDLEDFLESPPFHPSDRPKVVFVSTTVHNSKGNHRYLCSFHWLSKPELWKISRDGYVNDNAGAFFLFDFSSFYHHLDQLAELLRFVSTYSSMADFALAEHKRVLAPLIESTKGAMGGGASKTLQFVRETLEAGVDAVNGGQPITPPVEIRVAQGL